VTDDSLQRGDPHHLQRFNQRSLGGVLLGNSKAAHPRRTQAARHRQHPGDRPDRAVERQLADEAVAVETQRAIVEAEDGHGDGQVEPGALLGHLGRRQVDGQAALGKLEPRVADRRSHSLTRLLDGPVGEPDDGEVGQAGILFRAASPIRSERQPFASGGGPAYG